MCVSGLEFIGFEGETLLQGKSPIPPLLKCGASPVTESVSSFALMEWEVDCRKNAMLLSKFNDFMKINVSLPRLLLVRIHLSLFTIPLRTKFSVALCSILTCFSHHMKLHFKQEIIMFLPPCTFLLLPMNRSKLTIMANIIHGDKFLTHFAENNK